MSLHPCRETSSQGRLVSPPQGALGDDFLSLQSLRIIFLKLNIRLQEIILLKTSNSKYFFKKNTQAPLSANLYVDNTFVCFYLIFFFLRINVRQLEKSNPELCSKWFLFQACCGKNSIHEYCSTHGHQWMNKEKRLVFFEYQLGTGTAIIVCEYGFILSFFDVKTSRSSSMNIVFNALHNHLEVIVLFD